MLYKSTCLIVLVYFKKDFAIYCIIYQTQNLYFLSVNKKINKMHVVIDVVMNIFTYV